MGKFKNNTVG